MTRTETLFEILIPLNSNDGIEFSAEHREAWFDYVLQVAGGSTELPTVIGRWRAPDGRSFKEPMTPVRIACTEERRAEIASFTAKHFDQLEVFSFQAGTAVLFTPRPKPRLHSVAA